jgi:hypothetical protein
MFVEGRSDPQAIIQKWRNRPTTMSPAGTLINSMPILLIYDSCPIADHRQEKNKQVSANPFFHLIPLIHLII